MRLYLLDVQYINVIAFINAAKNNVLDLAQMLARMVLHEKQILITIRPILFSIKVSLNQ